MWGGECLPPSSTKGRGSGSGLCWPGKNPNPPPPVAQVCVLLECFLEKVLGLGSSWTKERIGRGLLGARPCAETSGKMWDKQDYWWSECKRRYLGILVLGSLCGRSWG